jgi:hypothetical protein
MKRDIELCRDILKYVQDNGKLYKYVKIELPQYDDESIIYNLELLIDANFLESDLAQYKEVYSRIKWEGHEFLANVLDDTKWNKAKKAIGPKLLSASFSVMVSLLNEFIKNS